MGFSTGGVFKSSAFAHLLLRVQILNFLQSHLGQGQNSVVVFHVEGILGVIRFLGFNHEQVLFSLFHFSAFTLDHDLFYEDCEGFLGVVDEVGRVSEESTGGHFDVELEPGVDLTFFHKSAGEN